MCQVRIHVLVFTKDPDLKLDVLYAVETETLKLKLTVEEEPIIGLEAYKSVDMIIVDGKNSAHTLEQVQCIRQGGVPLEVPIVVLVKEGWESNEQALEALGVKGYQYKAFAKKHKYLILCSYIQHISTIKKYRQQNILFDALFNNIPYMSWFKDTESHYIKVNQAFIEHSGKSEQEIQGKEDFYVWDGNIGEQCTIYDQEVMDKQESIVFEEYIPGKKGKCYFDIYKAPVLDENREVIGTIGIARDITEQRKSQARIEKLVYCDYLTGIGNRRGLYTFIENEVKKGKVDLTMMFMDLDNFKGLNDAYGHYYGDRVLQFIAEKLQKACEGGYVSRVGGDEFVVVWTGSMSRGLLKAKADKILEAVKTFLTKDSLKYVISASIGIVTGNIKEDSLEHILSKGDLALYKAKEKGKNQYVFYTSALEAEHQFNMQIQQALEQATQKGEIAVYYQPQYTPEKKLIGFEALMRWNNENYKDISTLNIIKRMEESIVIHQVGEYVLQQGMEFARAINQGHNDTLVVWINISCVQIMTEGFVEKVQQLMERLHIPPEIIGIEVTETILLDNIEENIKKLRILKEMGIKITIDDFGTGYSSLNYLFRLPLSELKIDKSFVDEVHIKEEHAKLVKLIIDIANLLQLEVIAEGVEHESQLRILKEMGVGGIQGYLFSKPLSQEEARNLANV